MRNLLLTGTAIAVLVTGIATASAQTDQRKPMSGQTETQSSPNGAGRSDAAPGQNKPPANTNKPGRSESAPGQNRGEANSTAPGRSGTAPGQIRPGATGTGGDVKDNRSEMKDDENKGNKRRGAAENDEGRGKTGEKDRRNTAGAKNDDDNGGNRQRNSASDGVDNDNLKKDGKDRNGRDRTNNASDDRNDNNKANRQAGSDNDRSGAKLTFKLRGEEKVKITSTLVERARPVDKTKIKFKINVGTVVPRGSIQLYEVPTTVISLVPEYRGYQYFVVDDEIIIVEPSTFQIVEVVDRSGGGPATGAARLVIDRSKFSMIKRELRSQSEIKVKINARQGEILPESVDLWDIPGSVVTEMPELRSYRYVVYQNEVLLIEPRTRRVIEVID
ncbi:DUF1236 domain-containing protein [Prosthecodimorpha staleyi]|uniref:DUF1236 domain-containing protein n=1 Tax=Prosthecodimorpha staleyi TaxID=2840188 RepID=A0A947CZ96_9HYPH|nr:DUF1236 domain-containing protein [Prosthecodimorpha staleyi]MBT9288030.1 DUF1236 domain-containing protein [Prosthecodimorpha staleyi]